MPLDSAERRAIEEREIAELQRVLREHEAKTAANLVANVDIEPSR